MRSFVTTRAAIATAIGKPWILEEFGMDVRMHASAHLLLACSASMQHFTG